MAYNVYRINRKTGDKKIFRTCKSIVRAQFGDILGLPAEEAIIEAA